MRTSNRLSPARSAHPGSYIRGEIIPPGLTVTAAAKLLGVGRPALSNLLNGNAALSPEMALRIEKAFGASSKELLEIQAAYDQAGVLKREPEIAVRSYAPRFLDIRAIQIEAWAGRMLSRSEMAVLLRKLVTSTGKDLSKVDFPAHENSQRKGWDGVVEADSATPWIPIGHSGWEFGCAEDPAPKANKDYAARVKHLAASSRKTMTFVFVTPRNWPGKTAWAAAKSDSGEWKNVRAYDASDLEQWLEQSIPAQTWLAERLPLGSLEIQSLDICWQEWAGVTDPELSKELFRASCDNSIPQFKRWLEEPPQRPCTVVANSPEEALAFLACAFERDELTALGFGDRAVVIRSADALARATNASSDFIAILASPMAEKASAGIHRRQHTIIVTRRNAVEGEPDVILDLVDYGSFKAALAAMGFDDDRIERLRHESGQSLTVLRRRLSSIPEIRTPPWAAAAEVAKRLIPLVLVGAWDSKSDADQAVLDGIGAGEREDIERTVGQLLAEEQSPVWSVGQFRGVVSKVDAFYAVRSHVTAADLKRFFQLARTVLSEDDPALDLPEDQRWAANLHGKSRKHSKALRLSLCETLVLLAVHGNNLFQERLGSNVEAHVDMVVRDLLTPLDPRTWQSQQRDLPRYAEAAPTVFLDILEDDLRSSEPKVYALMVPAKTGVFGSCPRTGLLWALENLAWSPQWLPRVVSLTAKLAGVEINDNWINKPTNTLESIFRSWMPQTAATLDQRIAALELLIKKAPAVGWKICIAQFHPRSTRGDYNYRPRWRNDALGAGRPNQSKEANEFARKALDLAISWPAHDENTLGDLVERLSGLPQNDQLKIWSVIEAWAAATSDEVPRAALRERIRRSTMTRRSIKHGLTQALRTKAASVYDQLAPYDVVLRHQWLFANHWIQESADELAKSDFDFRERDARITQLRENALREIYAAEDCSGLIRLCASGDADSTIGSCLAGGLLDDIQTLDFVDQLVSNSIAGLSTKLDSCLSGLIARFDLPARQEFLETMIGRFGQQNAEGGSAKIVRMLKSAPCDAGTWAFVDRQPEPIQRSYWEAVHPRWHHQDPADLNRLVDELIAVDRPRAAFAAVEMDFKEIESARLVRLLRAVATSNSEPPNTYHLEPHDVSDAFRTLASREDVESDDLARLEFLYIEVLDDTKYGIPRLERQLCESPGLFVEALGMVFRRRSGGEDQSEASAVDDANSALARSAYTLLSRFRRLPGTDDEGRVDTRKLLEWVTQSRALACKCGRETVGDGMIGQLLSHSPVGADGAWPCEAVRDVLEEVGTSDIADGMCVGVLSSRGAVWRGEGGSQERELAERYRGMSRVLMNQSPFTARVLEGIASMYDRHANWHDDRARADQRLRHW
jgi:addiction module HigA family antidote